VPLTFGKNWHVNCEALLFVLVLELEVLLEEETE